MECVRGYPPEAQVGEPPVQDEGLLNPVARVVRFITPGQADVVLAKEVPGTVFDVEQVRLAIPAVRARLETQVVHLERRRRERAGDVPEPVLARLLRQVESD